LVTWLQSREKAFAEFFKKLSDDGMKELKRKKIKIFKQGNSPKKV